MKRFEEGSIFILSVILFQIVTNIVVFFNVPFLRQVFGFFYLTFIPGIVYVIIFNLTEDDILEAIIFSIGFSIAILMIIGLVLNELLLIQGLIKPLSVLPLIGTLNFVVILPCLYFSPINLNFQLREYSLNKLTLAIYSILYTLIPFLSILGIMEVNIIGNNSIVLLMLLLIAVLFSLGTISKKILPPTFYPMAIITITLALVLHTSLITNHLVGWDYHSEYYVFKLVDNSGFWDSMLSTTDYRVGCGNSMLSVTILPTIYSKITNIEGTWLFKILYPLILSLIPLTLYNLYSKIMKKDIAILAIFFMISNVVSFDLVGFSAKQIIGEFFYVLLFLLITKENRHNMKNRFLFIVFSAGLIFSHYSTSYIFLFFISLTWLFSKLMQYIGINVNISSGINISKVMVFTTLTLFWYIYTSTSAPFTNIVVVFQNISEKFLVDFFDPTSRTTTVIKGLGGGEVTSFGHIISRIFFYIAEFFIIVGLIKILLNKEYTHFGKEYTVLSVLNLVIMISCIIIPNFARYFRAERFYQISLLFLAPYFVHGGQTIFKIILRRINPTIALNLILIVLIPFFLFQTGFFYEITKDEDTYSLALSMYRMDRGLLYDRITDDKEVTAAQWLLNYMSSSQSIVYGDFISTDHVLTSYGMITTESSRVLQNYTQYTDGKNYIYLRGINTIEKKLRDQMKFWDLSHISQKLNNQNNIYTNSNCKILLVQDKNIIP